MIKRTTVLVLMCAALVLTAGCSKRHKIHVESDTCWSGTVNDDQFIHDCGNSTYRVLGTLRCVKINKTTTTGYLRVRIDDRPWADTPDAYGSIQVCN